MNRHFLLAVVLCLSAVVFVGCGDGGDGKDEDIPIVVYTSAWGVENVTANSAYVTSRYTVEGAASVVQVGVAYSKTPGRLNVNIFDNQAALTMDYGIIVSASSSGNEGAFGADITDLAHSTTYYFKPYVKMDVSTNEYRNGYYMPHEYKSFETRSSSEPMDSAVRDLRDGKTYRIKKFGAAVWMIDDIRHKTGTGLYTWNNALKICPGGWYLPNNNGWDALAGVLKTDAAQYFTVSTTSRWWSATEVSTSYAWYWSIPLTGGSLSGTYNSSTSTVNAKTTSYAVRCAMD